MLLKPSQAQALVWGGNTIYHKPAIKRCLLLHSNQVRDQACLYLIPHLPSYFLIKISELNVFITGANKKLVVVTVSLSVPSPEPLNTDMSYC